MSDNRTRRVLVAAPARTLSIPEAAGVAFPDTGASDPARKDMERALHMGMAPPEIQALTLRGKTSSERKGEPIHAGAVMYFPDALAAMARLSVAGNNKHNPGEPLHWARGKSMDQMDAAQRHLITPDVIDPETGETELVAAFWRIGAQLQLQQERLLKERGIMPYSGITP